MLLSSCPVGGLRTWEDEGSLGASGTSRSWCSSCGASLPLPLPVASESLPDALSASTDLLRFRVGGMRQDGEQRRKSSESARTGRAPRNSRCKMRAGAGVTRCTACGKQMHRTRPRVRRAHDASNRHPIPRILRPPDGLCYQQEDRRTGTSGGDTPTDSPFAGTVRFHGPRRG